MRYIYIYETPGSKDAGYIKIGDSTDVHERVNTQFNTASVFDADNLEYTLLYQTEAVKADGSQFRDHDIHAILEQKGYHKRQIIRDNEVVKGKTEWFKIDVKKAIHLIEKFKEGVAPERIDIDRFQSFPMRPEQADAVERTERYFLARSDKPVEMLWNVTNGVKLIH